MGIGCLNPAPSCVPDTSQSMQFTTYCGICVPMTSAISRTRAGKFPPFRR